MFRLLTAAVSPGGHRGKLSTFIFHRVLTAPEPLMTDEPDAKRFSEMLDWITEQFRILEPLEACRRLSAGTLPARAAIITFDDGYRDNFEVALPLLQTRGLPAAFFIATAFADGSAMFNDRIRFAVRCSNRPELDLEWLSEGPVPIDSPLAKLAAVERLIGAVKYEPPELRNARVETIVEAAGADAPTGLMMKPAQLRKLSAAGMTIGGHTRSHPILRALPPDQARAEIEDGRSDLIALTGSAPLLFAYPNGRRGQDYEPPHMEMVRRAGYEFAFCTHPGFSTRHTDPFELCRFTPWGRKRGRFAYRALANLVGIG